MGLKEEFAARQAPRTTVPLRMDFSAASQEKLRERDAAVAELEAARDRNLPDVGPIEKRVAAAHDAVASLYRVLTVCALPPDRMDELIAAHPPTDEQKAKNAGAQWDLDTFPPALLAACVESNMVAEDWAELIHSGPVSSGEVQLLVQTAFDINDRSPDPELGKG